MNSEHAFSQSYPAVPSSVPRARHALTMFADATGASAEQVDAVRLAVSEALTNAVRHAYGAQAGAVHVSAARTGSELCVRIADDGRGIDAVTDDPGLGMGLGLIACMADYFAMSKRSEGGTEIRMRFGAAARSSCDAGAGAARSSSGAGARPSSSSRSHSSSGGRPASGQLYRLGAAAAA